MNLLLSLRGWYFFHVDPGHRVPSCVRISRTVTWAVANPESHAHGAFVDFIADSLDVTWAKQIFYSATSSIFHVDYTINSCWSRTLCAIKSEIPSPATVIAFIEPELTTPVHTQTCVVRRLLENAFLLKGKSNQPNSRLPSFNPFTHRENALTNYRVYDILSYDDSNYSGGIQGTPSPPPPLPLIFRPNWGKVWIRHWIIPLQQCFRMVQWYKVG